jgi:cytochrome c5
LERGWLYAQRDRKRRALDHLTEYFVVRKEVDRLEPIEIVRAALVAAMPVILALGGTLVLGSEASAKDDSTAATAAALNSVSGGGTTLRSVNVEFPDPGRLFPGGDRAEAINNNCLACHSAGMVLTQPYLSRAEWQSEVDKMRNIYKAPIAAEDVAAIVDYLASRENK